jgi:hypothetical protein
VATRYFSVHPVLPEEFFNLTTLFY